MNKKNRFLVDEIKEYSFLDSKFLEVKGGFYHLPFKIQKTDGKHNLKVCKDCRQIHSKLEQELNIEFEKFPNCCKHHAKLKTLEIFDKSDFSEVPKMISDKIMFTYLHIINTLDKEDWYEDISDYIAYNFKSFGNFPFGYGEPFQKAFYCDKVIGLVENIENIENKISSEKISNIDIKIRINKVINLLKPITLSESSLNTDRDFHLLLSTYEDWFKIFPFELPYFSHLKVKFKKILPIFTGKTRINRYLNTIGREVHTKESLMVVLLQITKNIISSINGLKLFNDGLISDIEKHQLDLILYNRKLELFELTKMDNNNKFQYVKILKRWFKGEKKFITDITSYIDKVDVNVKNSSLRPNRTDIAYFVHYLKETKELKLKSTFPSDKAWIEIGALYNKSSKNIQKAFIAINSNRVERLKKRKDNNIKYVIENMLKEHPEALKLAKDELKLAELNS
ncbi:hypothetical protein [Thalassobellus suaedae]|uniref:Uncharacterized protein n=1 Tax=Thalassobellus suaedae TaxID=3074124 RepID=A0ABY9XX70_9FLAO|nr:hypothetical protein RHP51_07845 [Flavobacteriaceae bacterium HL-DH14]